MSQKYASRKLIPHNVAIMSRKGPEWVQVTLKKWKRESTGQKMWGTNFRNLLENVLAAVIVGPSIVHRVVPFVHNILWIFSHSRTLFFGQLEWNIELRLMGNFTWAYTYKTALTYN